MKAVDVPEPPRTAAPRAPELTLGGIAEKRDGEAVERTAIITGPADALHFVRERDLLLGRYTIRVIEDVSVLLEDCERGGLRTLTLPGSSASGSPRGG